MKILTPGTEKKEFPQWWVGKRATCLHCNCAVELEACDEVQESEVNGRVHFAIASCPTEGCGGNVSYREVRE